MQDLKEQVDFSIRKVIDVRNPRLQFTVEQESLNQCSQAFLVTVLGLVVAVVVVALHHERDFWVPISLTVSPMPQVVFRRWGESAVH